MPKYLIVLKEKSDLTFLNDYDISNIEIHLDVIVFGNMTKDESHRLANHKMIESIEQDGGDSVDAVDYKTHETSYGFDMMGIGKFHDEGLTGQGMKVAILDTGIQKHTNLKIEGGINVYDSSKPWNENLANVHGTTVAGILNAQGKDGGLLGIIPDAKLYCVRIDDGTGPINTTTWSSQIAGISWAVKNGMDAVNCSFSSRIDSKARKVAFKIASDAGIAIFCSAGNNQPSGDTTSNTSRYPAKYPFTYANANIRADKTRYPSSCIGHGLNFSNGGVSARTTTASKFSTAVSSAHTNSTGTSLASPSTLGIFILYKQKYGENKDKIIQRMVVNAERLGDSYWYGAGLPKYPTKNYLNVQVRG